MWDEKKNMAWYHCSPTKFTVILQKEFARPDHTQTTNELAYA